MKKFLIISLLLGQVALAQKGKTMVTSDPIRPLLVEEVKRTGTLTVIPFKRYKLPNGMNVIVHEDHSDPIVYVDVTFHVGSAREQEGRSGFAHFFEHMMFQGSKHVADEQHFKVITEAGGTLNGSTNTDRTNYFETVPSNQLEKMLWLESDRMGFLLDSVTQRKFEVQRATVKNERGQRYDNAPYGLVGEKIAEALYPPGHPYSWLTIGYIEDLDRVDVNDLKRFYMRWYGANNAVLTVAGDVNTEEVVDLAMKYFGTLGQCPPVKDQKVTPVKLASTRYVSYEDQVKFPMLNMVFPTPPLNTKDDAVLDVLAQVLAGSQSSPFYKAFIESKKAVSVNVYQYSRELAGQFQIVVRANATGNLADIEKEVYRVLGEWEKKGVTEDDLAKFKAQYQSNLYNELSTVQGKGSKLAADFTLAHNANNIAEQTKRYLSLTKEDVMRVYRTYIKNKPCVVLSCVPRGKKDAIARADNWKMPKRKIESESEEYKNLTYKEPRDQFDRSKMPPARPAVPVPVPDFYTASINNVVPMIGVTESEIPKVNILLSFKAGHRYEPIQRSGQVQLLAAMLEQSTLKTSAEEMESRLDRLGSTMQVYAGDEDLNISVQSLKQNLAATMKIVEEALLEPKFDASEFELEKKKQLDAIGQMQTSAASIADIAYRHVLYGQSNVMSIHPAGNAETVGALSLQDIRDQYSKLSTSILSVAVTGDASREEVSNALSFLSRLPSGEKAQESDAKVPPVRKTTIYFVDKKNAAQSEIRIGYIAMPFDATGEFYRSTIMNFPFAGAFNSRINYLLREIKGWTYGTRGAFNGTHYAGPYTISGGFKSATTDSTLMEIFAQLKEYVDKGVTEEELNFARNAMAQSDALRYESPMHKLSFIKRVLEYNLPRDYVAKEATILATISKNDVDKLAKAHLPYDNMVVVVVGDRQANLEKVKKLGYDVVEIDMNGKTVN